MWFVRSVTLDDEALEDEVLDDVDGVTVDGILVDKNLFRVLLLCLGTSDKSSEFCGISTSWQRNTQGINHPPRRQNG